MIKYLSASEAIEELNIPASTFYRLVKEGKITKYYPTAVSKHGMYSPIEIARLCSQFRQASDVREIGETDWVKSTDIGNVYDLEYPFYGDKTNNPSLVRKWHEQNPHMYRILFNKNERRDLWGVINMLPMEEETIFKLLRGDLQIADLDVQRDILTFDKPGVYNFYVTSVILNPQKWQHFVVLISSLFDYWIAQAPECTVGKMYGRVVTWQGEILAKKLFWSPLWYINDDVYMLDMTRPNPSRLVQNFQKSVKRKCEDTI